MGDINIAGIDKAEILQALYNRARPQGMGFMHYDPKPLSYIEAQKLLIENRDYLDYIKGRVLKVNLINDYLDTRLYDRDNGPGAAFTALQLAGLVL